MKKKENKKRDFLNSRQTAELLLEAKREELEKYKNERETVLMFQT